MTGVGRVYVPVMPSRVNCAPALVFGKVVGPFVSQGDVQHLGVLPARPVLAKLRHGLADFTENDWLLLLGDPVLIAAATLYAVEHLPHNIALKVLKWDRQEKVYLEVQLDEFP